jgi:Fe2+ or Zn2+ uptake regulation protein
VASESDPVMREAHEDRLAWLQARCRDRGLPLTDARRAVLASILDLGLHPTADDVLARAAGRSPDVGFQIEDIQVQLRGICRNCQKLDSEELDQEEDS